MPTRPLPAVVDVVPALDLDNQPCLCLCAARHPDATGICQGIIDTIGARVHFNSLYAPQDGVLVCLPCIGAYPELT